MVAPWVEERRSLHRAEFRVCLADWLLREQKQPQTIVDACMLLLEELYLLSLRLPSKVVLPPVPGPRNYWFLFRRHVASLLGWTERREEGEHHGFSDSINKFVREIWWPDEGAEALHRPQLCKRQCSAIPTPQVLPSDVDALPTTGTAEESSWCGVGVENVRPGDSDSLPSLPTLHGKGRGRTSGTQRQQMASNSGVESGNTVGAEAAFNQQLLLRSSNFHAGRMVRQRLELGATGTILLHQSVEGLLPPSVSKEGTSDVTPHEDTTPTSLVKKKPTRKRRTASSSGQ